MGLKAGAAALAVWLAADEVVWAQQPETNTNKLTIVKRKHRYSSRIQLLNEPTPAPVPTEMVEPEQEKDSALKELSGQSPATRMPQMPVRRPLPKKEPNQGLLPLQPEAQTNAIPELKNWGWLANEAEESRRYLQASKEAETNEPGQATMMTGTANTQGTNRVETGALTEYNYKPALGSTAQTSTVERVVEDKAVRLAERQKETAARQAEAKKENLDMTNPQDAAPLFTTTNETLGLTRTHRDESVVGQDFQQTRALMSEINSRYKLNINLEDAARQPVAALPPVADKPQRGEGRENQRSDVGWRPASLGEMTGGTSAALSRTPSVVVPSRTSLDDANLRSSSVERGRIAAPASSLIEPPKPSKSFGTPSGLPGSSSPFSSTPAARPATSTYGPSGFTPAAPYKSTFESSTLSR